MLKQERLDSILQEVDTCKRVSSAQLSARLHVSEDTIRRDLNQLAATGQVLKVYGGALALRSSKTNPAYIQIAQKTIALIRHGMLLFLAGGPITNMIAGMLPPDVLVTVFTFDLPTAFHISQYPNIRVIIMGGQLSGTPGHPVVWCDIQPLMEIHADLCLIEVEDIPARPPLNGHQQATIQIKKAMVSAATQTVVLCPSANLACAMPVCRLNPSALLITEFD